MKRKRKEENTVGKVRNQKGFTLVELIVVLVILAILAAILVPALLGHVDRARQEPYVIAARSVQTAAQTICSEAYAEDDNRIAVIKLNYTSNFQKTDNGGHYCQLENIYVYESATSNKTKALGKSAVAKKYFDRIMKLAETNDAYLAGTTWIFFDKSGRVVSNSDYKIAGQGAVTQFVFRDRSRNLLATVKYNEKGGWSVQ